MQKRYCQVIVYFVMIAGMCMFFACRNPAPHSHTEHPQLTDSIFNQVKLLPDSVKVAFVNEAYSKFKPGARDRWKRYTFFFDYYNNKRDFYRADNYGDSLIAVIKPLATDTHYQEDLMRSYFLKGDAQLTLNKFEQAIDLYDKANEIQTRIYGTGTRHFFNYNMRIANGFYRQGNYRQAIRFYKLTLAERPSNNQPWLIFSSTQALKDNIGLAFAALSKTDSALYYYDDALAYIAQQEHHFTLPDQKIYIKVARGIIYGNKATVLTKLGRYAEVEKLFNEDILLTRHNFGEEDGEISREKLAMIYLGRHETGRVLRMLDTIKTWANMPGYQAHKQRYLKILAEVSAQTGNFKTAHQASQQLHVLNDSIMEQKSAHIYENIDRLIAYNQKLDQIELLNKEKAQSRLLLQANVVSLLLAVLMVVVLGFSYRKSKQNVAQLKILNEEVHIRNVELAKAFDALENSYRANERITRSVAHDLRSPLVAMRAFIQLLGDPKLPESEKENIAKLIYTNCTDSLSLIEDMLNNNACTNLFTLQPVRLDELIKHCVLVEIERCKAKDQHITFVPAEATVLGDEEKLRRVFDNLLTNAVKFTGKKGKIKVEMRIVDQEVIVSVTDNGIGIPTDMQSKLFDFSADIKRRGTDNEASHGLGLFICRQIVEAHKGQIWFNAADKGATFNVSLKTYLS